MTLTHAPIDLDALAEAYAEVAITCCQAGAQLHAAANLLKGRDLRQAEAAIESAMDALAKVIADMPKIEEDLGKNA